MFWLRIGEGCSSPHSRAHGKDCLFLLDRAGPAQVSAGPECRLHTAVGGVGARVLGAGDACSGSWSWARHPVGTLELPEGPWMFPLLHRTHGSYSPTGHGTHTASPHPDPPAVLGPYCSQQGTQGRVPTSGPHSHFYLAGCGRADRRLAAGALCVNPLRRQAKAVGPSSCSRILFSGQTLPLTPPSHRTQIQGVAGGVRTGEPDVQEELRGRGIVCMVRM